MHRKPSTTAPRRYDRYPETVGRQFGEHRQKVHDKLPEIQASLPSDVKLGVIVDTSTNILNTIDSLKETIMITFIVVMFVVFIFLGRWRATFIIILTIPISLIAAFAYLLASGNTLNIISLSSLSIAIGMVVDDAIVVLENVTTHIERGSKPKQAAVHATNEVAISVIASTLTMLAVFLPLTMVTGMAGILFKQLGWIVSIIMIVSTVGALTLTPMLCSQLLRLDPKKGRLYVLFFTPIEKALNALDVAYARFLSWAVRHRKTVIFGAMLIFAGSMMLVPTVKTEFSRHRTTAASVSRSNCRSVPVRKSPAIWLCASTNSSAKSIRK